MQHGCLYIATSTLSVLCVDSEEHQQELMQHGCSSHGDLYVATLTCQFCNWTLSVLCFDREERQQEPEQGRCSHGQHGHWLRLWNGCRWFCQHGFSNLHGRRWGGGTTLISDARHESVPLLWPGHASRRHVLSGQHDAFPGQQHGHAQVFWRGLRRRDQFCFCRQL